ncbi:testis-specific serine/threonine-protein kinase 6 isoform X3 [Halyomorpha halys]|uniref:testis-specific serine/threonine-protein kinase 6 isoform X3 n=1 Tax=Halyomorpha halys TaxID=286706 RepID=UPI0006D4D834|nr:testis-specific serine/threonine-protein kinase 6-like isoform X2 [Halyomorpha halys]
MSATGDSSLNLPFTKSEEHTFMVRGYTVEKRLGEGSYAKVFLCKKISNNKCTFLACKVIDTKNAPVDYVNKFLPRELNVLMRIGHPNIIHVDFIFQRKAKYYMFMRYAETGDLLDYLMTRGRVSENRARFWIAQCALALHYIHGYSSTYCGSIAYTAPEVLRGRPYQPKKSDIWSVGVVLFVMLNRKLPYPDSSPKKVLEKQMARHINHNQKVEELMTPELKAAFQKLLEPDARERYNAAEFLNCDWVKVDPRYRQEDKKKPTSRSLSGDSEKTILIKKAKERASKGASDITVLRPQANDDMSILSILGTSNMEQDPKQEETREKILQKARQQKIKRSK